MSSNARVNRRWRVRAILGGGWRISGSLGALALNLPQKPCGEGRLALEPLCRTGRSALGGHLDTDWHVRWREEHGEKEEVGVEEGGVCGRDDEGANMRAGRESRSEGATDRENTRRREHEAGEIGKHTKRPRKERLQAISHGDGDRLAEAVAGSSKPVALLSFFSTPALGPVHTCHFATALGPSPLLDTRFRSCAHHHVYLECHSCEFARTFSRIRFPSLPLGTQRQI